MKKAFILTATLLLFFTHQTEAQKFKNSAGFRLGHISGVTYQNHYSENQAFEVILGFHQQGVQAYVFNEWFKQIPFNIPEDFYFYYGVGGHIGYAGYSQDRYYYDNANEIDYDYSQKNYYTVGVDGITGVEYRIYAVPMTVGLELQPSLDFYGFRYVDFDFWNFQVSFKYIF